MGFGCRCERSRDLIDGVRSHVFLFFTDTATPGLDTLSLHDALPICGYRLARPATQISAAAILDALHGPLAMTDCSMGHGNRSEEHTSELQSQSNPVCRLLLEKTKTRPRSTSPPRTYTARTT